MDKKIIDGSYEKRNIDRENTLAAKLDLRDFYSKRRTIVDQMFKMKNYINSLPLFKRTLAKWILEPWVYKTMQNIPDTLSADGCFGYPWVSLKD